VENAEEARKIIIQCSMSYDMLDRNDAKLATGECEAAIDPAYVTLFPKFGDILPFHLRQITTVEAENYRITLHLSSKQKFVLFDLGYCYEDFLRNLIGLRNEVILKDLLMNETAKKPDVEMKFVYFDETGKEKQRDVGKLRIYETGLGVIPENSEVLRIPYSDIANVKEEDYSIKIGTELGEQLQISKLGSEFDAFRKALSDAYNALQNKAASALTELCPGVDPISLRRIAGIMREGRAARRSDIERINPKVWASLEKKITDMGLNEYYSFLKGLARQEEISIGFKRGLMGDLTGEYIWFLMPIYGNAQKEYGNAVAMEAAETTGEETTGKATYFFRITSRKDYPTCGTIERLDEITDKLLKKINRCMIDINFRREPVYLPNEKLEEPAYYRYNVAAQKLPSLRLLRDLYIGRVIHASPEQWKTDVMDLLRFNVNAQMDNEKWTKSTS
jgi:hypothetical protein